MVQKVLFPTLAQWSCVLGTLHTSLMPLVCFKCLLRFVPSIIIHTFIHSLSVSLPGFPLSLMDPYYYRYSTSLHISRFFCYHMLWTAAQRSNEVAAEDRP